MYDIFDRFWDFYENSTPTEMCFNGKKVSHDSINRTTSMVKHWKYILKKMEESQTPEELMYKKAKNLLEVYEANRNHLLHESKTLYLKGKGPYEGYYFVKKFFTQGLQLVAPNTEHVFETQRSCLDLYTLRTGVTVDFVQNELAIFSDKKLFDNKRIHPGLPEIIPPSTLYLVMAPYHACFKKEIRRSQPIDQQSSSVHRTI